MDRVLPVGAEASDEIVCEEAAAFTIDQEFQHHIDDDLA
jgi:hypothetical protein